MKFVTENAKYINPFKSDETAQVYFNFESVKVFHGEQKGWMIVKNPAGGYDYVVDGTLCTQRCGANEELLTAIATRGPGVDARFVNISH